jgi:hypothetical protein
MRLCVQLDPGNADWETGDRGEQGWEDSRRFVVPVSFFSDGSLQKKRRGWFQPRNVGSRSLLPVLGAVVTDRKTDDRESAPTATEVTGLWPCGPLPPLESL